MRPRREKKRKSLVQSTSRSENTGHSGGSKRKTGNSGVLENEDYIKTDSGKKYTDIKVDTGKQDSKDDSEHTNLKRNKERLEEKIAEKAMP